MSFKLPNFLNAGHLNTLRFEMGAALSDSFKAKHKYTEIDLPEIQRLRSIGVDVEFDDIQVLDDRTLSYKGYRVLLYIRDIAQYGRKQSMPKYHLSYCRTLETMRANKRFQRYVVANREDGLFHVNFVDTTIRTDVAKLDICQNCLAQIAWQGYGYHLPAQDKASYVRDFRLSTFFEMYPRDLLSVRPDHSTDDAPLNDYTEDWGDISERKKRDRAFTCSKCATVFSQRFAKFLHVHHENGLKYDNSDRNLEVLCIKCHAEEPMHGHMKSLPDYLEFLTLELGVRA